MRPRGDTETKSVCERGGAREKVSERGGEREEKEEEREREREREPWAE